MFVECCLLCCCVLRVLFASCWLLIVACCLTFVAGCQRFVLVVVCVLRVACWLSCFVFLVFVARCSLVGWLVGVCWVLQSVGRCVWFVVLLL